MTVNGANLVLTAKDFNYRVYGSGTSFTATDNNNTRTIITGATIQNTINAIKADVYANPCDITFYAAATGTTQLDIGTATMEFNRSTADSNWSSAANGIKLHGSVKSASTSTTGGVVIGSNGAVVTSDATIQNTSTGAGNAIYWNSTGTLTVNNGGKVSAVGSTAYAIRKAASGTVDVSGTGTTVSSAYYGIYGSSGAINVSGGTVSSTGIRTIYITGTGTVTVSGSGTVSNSYNGGYAINNSSTGATTVSGGTVIATGSGNSYAISQGDVNVTGGTVSSTYQAINASSKTINISGGTVTGTGPQTIMSRGTLNVSGGTVSNTGTGLAIYNADVYNVNIGTVTISGTALVTSAPTSSGTICNITSSGSANNIVNVVGGTVRNTANSTSARAIHNYCPGGVINVYGGTIQATSGAAIENERSTAGSIMLGNSPTITGSSSEGAIRVPSNSLGVETSGANTFNPASKTYPIHINSTPLAGAIAVFNGAAPVNRIDNFPLVNANYRLITSGNNLVVQAQTLITAVNLNNTAPAYGDTITATVTPSGATSTATWQWQYHNGSTWSNISGATASSYTVPATMIGAQLRVTATGTGEYYGTVTSAATSAVTPKTLTWNAGSASNKVYDGNATATVVSAPTLNGVINSDTVTITVGTAAFADKNVGNNKAVTGFGWGIGGAHANYYLITTQPSFGFANITPRPLSWNGSGSVDNKEYDGTTAATIANLPMSNIVVSDTVTAVPGTAVVSFQTATVGNNKAIVYTAGTWVLTGADADNYTAPTGNPGWNTPNITPRQLTWTGNGTVSDKVYDGNADAQVTSYPGFGAVVAGENVSLNFSGVTAVQFMDGTGTIPDGAPGLNKPVASTGVWALSGTDAANYIVPAGQPGWNPASITIDADYQYVVTYGNDPASGNPSTSFFTATCNNGVTVVAQDEGSMWTIMQAIRNHANGNNCSVTFDSGTAGVPLDIGSQYAEFNGNWGSVELHGSVTSTAPINQGTIYVSTPMSITSDADIEHTGFNSGNAVKIVSDGTFHVIGGTVSATGQWSSAIRNESDSTVIVSDGVVTCACDASDAAIENVYSGAVEVTGGTVECTGKGNAIRNSNDGSVTISGTALVTAAYYNGTVYNNGNGVVTVRGGTVQNTYDASSVPMGAPLCVIYNHAGGTINAYGGVIDLRMTAIRNNAAGTVSLGNDPILNGIYTAEGKVSAVTAGPDEFTPGENVYGIYITSSPIVSGSTVAVVDGADFLGNFVSWNYDGVLNVGYVCTASGDDLVLSAAATVYFYHNAPDATGDMEPQTELYGEIENLAPNGFSRDGYVFMGWALTDDGPVAYADEAPFTFIENITLFAVWLAPISEGDDGSGEDDGWYLQVVDGTPGAVLGTDWWILRKGDGSRRPAPNTNPNYVGDNLVDVVPGNTIDHDPYDGDYDPWIVPEVPGFPPSDYDYIFDPNVPEIRIYDRDSGDEVAVVDLPTGEVDYKIAVAVLKNFMYSNVREQTLGQYFPLDTDLDPLEGTVAIITVFDALGEIVAGPYAGRLDADGNIILDDVVPHSAVGVGYTLEVVIRSEVFEVEPFAIRRGPSVVLDDDLDTDDTEIGTVWPGDMPGVTNDAPVVIIVITDEGDGTTTTNSVPGHLEGPDPDGPYVIVIDDGSELPPGEIVDIIFGDEPPYIVPIDPGDGTVTGIENDYTYVITGGSGSFVATRNGGIHKVTPAAGLGIQAAIVAIQADADGHDCSITFDPGLATALDIGNAHIDFDDFTRAWGLITLHGSVENSSWTTISIYGGVSVISDADILATGSLCSAIALDSTGDLAITGGTMTGDVAVFKVDDSTGDIYILGGTLISTAGYEAVCYDSRYGELVLGNAPTIEGFISAPAGTIRVITGSNPNTFNPGEEIYAVAIWDFYDNLIISGTTVAVVDGADFLANFTAVNPGYVLDILGDDLILRNPTPVQPPLVDNTTPEYGDTLTATEQPAGATVTWQWEWYDDVNNEWLPITDATNATYTVVADDIGLELRVVVNGEGLYAGAAASAATDPVAPRTLTLVNGAVHPREYDGTTVAVVGDQPELAGVITGDDVTFIPGTASFADKDVGLGKTATGAGYALDGADAGLYTLAAQPVFIADIIPLQLTWVGNGKVANKQYDGNAFASILSLPTISSALPGETVMLNSTGAWACFIDEHCGIAKHVYSEGVWLLSGPYAGNYSLPGQPSWNPADIYAPEGTDGNGWYLDVPDGSDYANGAPGTDWWRLREGTGSRRPALNDNPNYVGTNLVNVVPGNTIEHYPGDNEFVPPWVVPEVENCPPSDYDYIFDPNVPEIRVYDRETGNLVVVIDIPSGDETHPNANANLTDTLYTGVGGQTIGKYFPADDDTAPLEGRVVEVWILDDNGITADGPLAGHLDAAGNIILDDVLEGSLADWGTDFALVVHVGDDTFIKKPVTIVQGATADLKITAIRMITATGNIEITVEGCVNTAKQYALFGHHEEISARYDNGAVSQNAEVIAAGRQYGVNDGVGQRVFTFPKPGHDRFFFHARQID
ncbi:MAG: YDG domain-containing protein [Kiritimatiellaeota bacterium]|nr:YDG domain-containing protein [Kiritimatiellota bacterium]